MSNSILIGRNRGNGNGGGLGLGEVSLKACNSGLEGRNLVGQVVFPILQTIEMREDKPKT